MTEPVLTNPAFAPVPVSHLDALPVGTRLGEFEITALLGVGGFGLVYQAIDHSLQRDVAIKEYMPAALARRSAGLAVTVPSSANLVTFSEGLKSFIAEARLLAQFDHPSLVKVFRFWEENSTAYMAMPLYRGITLKQARTQMRSPPPEEWMRKLLWSVLGALKVLHNGNTMHRDVSPENIFLQDMGPPVLLDLGAARRAIHETKQQLTATLKYSYAPIEQYGESSSMRQGPWTDLYSLAAVVYGCLANELPLPATLRVVRDRQPSIASVAQAAREQFGLNYSDEFVLAIDKALSIRPTDRPKNANSFARLMDLHVPAGMSKFDWRTDLGDIYLPPPALQPFVQTDQLTTVAMQSPPLTPDPAAIEETVEITESLFSGGRTRKPPRLWTIVAAAGCALLAVGTVLFWMGWDESGSGPEAAPVTPVQGASAPVAGASVAKSADDVAGAQPKEPPPAIELAASPIQLPIAMPAVKSSPARLPAHRPRKIEPVKPVLERAPAIGSVAPTPVSPPSAVRPEAVESPAQGTASRPRTPPLPPETPQTRCADRSFLTRPMCTYNECQKPEFAHLAMCAEIEKRSRESRGSRD